MEVEYYKQMLIDGAFMMPETLYVNDEASAKNCIIALMGTHKIRRLSPEETPEYLKDKIGLRISKLENGIKIKDVESAIREVNNTRRERILGIQKEIKEACGEYK